MIAIDETMILDGYRAQEVRHIQSNSISMYPHMSVPIVRFGVAQLSGNS